MLFYLRKVESTAKKKNKDVYFYLQCGLKDLI